MDIDIRIASKGIIETLRERIAELEDLEASGASTPDTHEELVDLHEFLRKLYMISLSMPIRRCNETPTVYRPPQPIKSPWSGWPIKIRPSPT